MDDLDVFLAKFAVAAILLTVLVIVLAYIFPPETDWQRKDRLVRECLALETYTREECIILVGGGK